jgi:hypothetical protein
MRYGEDRDKYSDEIALCMGFDSVYDLEDRVQDLLRIISPDRLETILRIAETAAINCASYVQQNEDAEKLADIEKMARAHVDSKTKGVRDLMEEILVIINEAEAVPTQEVYAIEYERLAEETDVS